MKLFSRKSLVAGATAIAVSFAGVNVATAEEGASQPAGSVEAPANNDEKKQDEGDKGQDDKNQNDGSGSSVSDLSSSKGKDGEKKEVDPDEIKAWIGVVSAVIGVLGSIFAFISKYIDIPGQK